jgi:hypothetical protein
LNRFFVRIGPHCLFSGEAAAIPAAVQTLSIDFPYYPVVFSGFHPDSPQKTEKQTS